jgi:hypothetical protein
MVSIGFKELIEKLEEYFGKKVVKVGIGIAGLFALLFVIGVGVTSSVYPLALWLGALFSGNPDLATARDGISTVVTIVWIVTVLAGVVGILGLKRDVREARDIADDYQTLKFLYEGRLKDADEQVAWAKQTNEDARQILERSRALNTELESKLGAMEQVNGSMVSKEPSERS